MVNTETTDQLADKDLQLAWVAAVALAVTLGIGLYISSGNAMLAMLGTVGTVAVIGSLASTEICIYVLITVACFGGLIKGLHASTVTLFLKDALLGVAFAHWVWDGITGSPRESITHRMAIPTLMFVLWCGAEMFNTITADPLVALAGFRSWVMWIPVFFIAYDTFTEPEQFRRMVTFICAVSLATGVYMIIQQRIGFGHLYSLSGGFHFYDSFYAHGRIRAVGTYAHPGMAGPAMSFAALLAGGLTFAYRLFSKEHLMLLAAAPVCIAAMGASGSRSAFVGFAMGVALILILTRRGWWLLAGVMLLVTLLTQSQLVSARVLSERYSASRLNMSVILHRVTVPFRHGVKAVSEYPLGVGVATGIGIGRMRGVAEERMLVSRKAAGMVENEFGRALKELGIVGAGLFLWLLWRGFSSAMWGWLQTEGHWRLAAAVLTACSIGLAAQLMVGSALYGYPGAIYFWMSIAFAARTPDYQRKHEGSPALRASEKEDSGRQLEDEEREADRDDGQGESVAG